MSMGDAGARDVASCSNLAFRFRAILMFAEGVLPTKYGKPHLTQDMPAKEKKEDGRTKAKSLSVSDSTRIHIAYL